MRIISATHKDLAAEVQGGRFRQDLYYRLNVIDIVIPPLRDRRDDLPALCVSLLERIAAESGMRSAAACRPACSSRSAWRRSRAMCVSWRTCCTARWP